MVTQHPHPVVDSLVEEDLAILARAVERLEHPSLAARLGSVVGTPIELALHMLPNDWYRRLHASAESVIGSMLGLSVIGMDTRPGGRARDTLYSVAGALCGAVGGFFGLPGLAAELPISTGIMLRAIAQAASAEGEDPRNLETRLACVQVFALGGHSHADDAAETGYYGVRMALASSVSAAAEQIAHHGVAARGTPALVNLVREIASRFGVNLTQKAAAQMVPVVGAAGAAAVNLIFVNHYRETARCHFAIRRLERKYGQASVKAHYERLAAAG